MSLKSRTRRCEKTFSKWYDGYIAALPPEEFLAECLRVLTWEAGSFTVEEVEQYVSDTGGEVSEWRPVLDDLLSRCEVVRSRRCKETRYRYTLPRPAQEDER